MLKGHWRIALGGTMMVAAAVLLGVGIFGLSRGDDLPEELSGTSTATPIPTPSAERPAAIEQPTPTPASNAPVVHMIIEKLGVDAPVMELGLDANLAPQVPLANNTPAGLSPADVVAWYNFGAKPGHGGNVVFSGHVDWLGKLGVFGQIRNLQEGDLIRVFLQDGTDFTYQVTSSQAIPWDDPEVVQLMLPTDYETITLVTCGGTWMPNRADPIFGGNYTHRIVVRATPAQS